MLIVALMIIFPVVSAINKNEEKTECKLSEIATCFIAKFFDFFINLMNMSLQPLLVLIKDLLASKVNISPLMRFWKIITYVISIFYSLLLLYSGFNFITSGYDAVKREKAKTWVRNIILMIFFINISYFIYSWLLEISSHLTQGVLNLIPNDIFNLNISSFKNLGLKFSFILLYLIILMTTLVSLGIRYFCVMLGLISFPLGLFLYFFEPLKEYGKLVINFLGIFLIMPFLDSLVLLIGSQLNNVGVFSGNGILIMIISFTMVILLNIILILFVISKSASAVMNNSVTSFVRLII